MMEAVLTPSFASSSSAAQLHEFTFNKLPSLHTSVKSPSWGLRKQYALLISLSVFIWWTCTRLGQPRCLDDALKSIRVGFYRGMTCFRASLCTLLRPRGEGGGNKKTNEWSSGKDQSNSPKTRITNCPSWNKAIGKITRIIAIPGEWLLALIECTLPVNDFRLPKVLNWRSGCYSGEEIKQRSVGDKI